MNTDHEAPSSPGEDLSRKRVFTTGEAAAVCKVSQQTIIRCFDAGRLTGFRVPGSKFRRIPRDELIRFMKANNIPLDALEGGKRRVLVVDDDHAIIDIYVEMLSRDSRLEIKTATNGYDAGMFTESFRPHLIVLDYLLPDINGNHVCKRIRENPAFNDTRILAVSGVVRDEEVGDLLRAGANAFMRKPFTIDALCRKISEMLEIEGVGESGQATAESA